MGQDPPGPVVQADGTPTAGRPGGQPDPVPAPLPRRRPLNQDPPAEPAPLPGRPMAAPAPEPVADEGPVDPMEPIEPTARRRSRTRTTLLTALTIVVLLVVAGIAGIELASRRVLNNVERIPQVFEPLDQAKRPQKPVGTDKTLNVLLVGLDTGAAEQSASSDAIMLVHVAADRRTASFVSIPRDSWVAVPDRGPATISSAYPAGGPALLVRTVEQLTALRIDHFAVVDFAGFKDITNAVGGVDVRVQRATAAFPAGVNHLDGDAAVAY